MRWLKAATGQGTAVERGRGGVREHVKDETGDVFTIGIQSAGSKKNTQSKE